MFIDYVIPIDLRVTCASPASERLVPRVKIFTSLAMGVEVWPPAHIFSSVRSCSDSTIMISYHPLKKARVDDILHLYCCKPPVNRNRCLAINPPPTAPSFDGASRHQERAQNPVQHFAHNLARWASRAPPIVRAPINVCRYQRHEISLR